MNTSSTDLIVGKELVSYCGKCKMDLGHTIMSMVSGSPKRVMCRTCKSEHNFKAKKGIKEPGADASASVGAAKVKKPRATKADKVVPVELEWQKQMNATSRPIRSYAANESFLLGDRVNHPSFGEGVVQKLVYPNKMEIIFRMDIKVLVHAGAPRQTR